MTVPSPPAFAEFVDTVLGPEGTGQFAVRRGVFDNDAPLGWERVNDLVSNYAFSPPRVRLAYSGSEPLAAVFYETRHGSGVDVDALHHNLAMGATLVIDAVDDADGRVRSLAQTIETSCRFPVQANVYSSFGTVQGFGAHTDAHDVVVVQSAGRKLWKIYGPVMEDDQATPLWEGHLETGDVMYFPRGWWHSAVSCDEPSMHITFAVSTPTARDFVSWLAADPRLSEVSMTVPRREADLEAWADFAGRVGPMVAGGVGDPAVQAMFLEWCRTRLPDRRQASLPLKTGSARR